MNGIHTGRLTDWTVARVRLPGSAVTIRRTMSRGNAGDQIKTSGLTRIENVIAVSNCGFFEGQPFTLVVDPCRSGGSALALNFRIGDDFQSRLRDEYPDVGAYEWIEMPEGGFLPLVCSGQSEALVTGIMRVH